jgi:dipeptidyl aminopeptidase/acylaminoacyl peptidase
MHFRISFFPLLIALALPCEAQGPRRGLTLDDVLSLEDLTTSAASPDGRWLATVVQRARSNREIYSRDYLNGDERADVWLVPLGDGTRRNLTNGIADKSGYWSPVWSPDGSRLAMLSTKGGDNVRLYVWDKAKNAVTRISDRGIDMYAKITLGDGRGGGPVVWLDANSVMIAQLPEGEAPEGFMTVMRSSRVAPGEWAKAERGEAAVSVIESGSNAHVQPTKRVELRVFDVVRGSSRVLTSVPYLEGGRTFQIAPNGKDAAVLINHGHVTMDVTHRLGRQRSNRQRLGIVALSGDTTIRWIDSMFVTGLGSWAPDGSRVAVFGKPDEWQNVPGDDFYLVSLTGAVQRATPPESRVTTSYWTSDGRPVVFAQPRTVLLPSGAAAPPNPNRKAAWLRLDPGTPGVTIAGPWKEAPSALTPTADQNTYLAIADSVLWRMNIATGNVAEFSSQLPKKVTAIVSGSAGVRPALTDEILIQTGDVNSPIYYRILMNGSGAPVQLAPPSPGAKAEAYLSSRKLAVFSDAGRTGSMLWSVSSEGAPTTLMTLNTQLASIADPKRILFQYRGIDGDSLKGFVMLPSDYQEGKRYPTVVWVYAGSIVRDSVGSLRNKNDPHPLNLVPLTTRGYAVLVPSMPLRPEGEASDPYIDLPKGVLSAVDKLVEMGIADPGKLGVMGQSYGGYSTYSLITYTTRFKAAVSMAGVSDLISLYGQFDLRDRYTDTPHENLFYQMLSEGGQTRMGVPFWDNLWRYLRNSPLYFVDRVQTPLLIVGADQDYVTITQGEQFFTALHRQGKTAKFLRYWGDEHVIGSLGNIRHMWSQIYDWFDTHVAKAK